MKLYCTYVNMIRIVREYVQVAGLVYLVIRVPASGMCLHARARKQQPCRLQMLRLSWSEMVEKDREKHLRRSTYRAENFAVRIYVRPKKMGNLLTALLRRLAASNNIHYVTSLRRLLLPVRHNLTFKFEIPRTYCELATIIRDIFSFLSPSTLSERCRKRWPRVQREISCRIDQFWTGLSVLKLCNQVWVARWSNASRKTFFKRQ